MVVICSDFITQAQSEMLFPGEVPMWLSLPSGNTWHAYAMLTHAMLSGSQLLIQVTAVVTGDSC